MTPHLTSGVAGVIVLNPVATDRLVVEAVALTGAGYRALHHLPPETLFADHQRGLGSDARVGKGGREGSFGYLTAC